MDSVKTVSCTLARAWWDWAVGRDGKAGVPWNLGTILAYPAAGQTPNRPRVASQNPITPAAPSQLEVAPPNP